MSTQRKSSKSATRRRPRKDRLIQTRVPEDLETTLKEEAERRRLTVSHLIRSVLEDTFHLVDDVVSDFDKVVTDSVDLARNVGRNARRLAAPSAAARSARPDWDRNLADIYGWNELVLHRAATCKRCGTKIERGERAFVGLGDKPRRARVWLCQACMEAL
jgi:hypothetical protein